MSVSMQKINTHHISYILFAILGLLLVASNNLVLIMFGAALIALTIVYNMVHSMNIGIWIVFHAILGLCAIVAGDFFSSLFGITTAGMMLILSCMIPFILISGKQLPVKWLSCFILFSILYISLMMHAMNINNKSIESEMEKNLLEPNAGVITVRYIVFASDYHIGRHNNCLYINSAPYSLVKIKPTKIRCDL